MNLLEIIRFGLMAAAMLLAVAGFGLVLLGQRGKRVGDHPHCAQCGYDLFGIAGQSCPECGAFVGDVSRITAGRKLARKRWIILGALLLTGHGVIYWRGLNTLMPQYWHPFGNPFWNPYSRLPNWVLVAGIKLGDINALDAAGGRYLPDDVLGQIMAIGVEQGFPNERDDDTWSILIRSAHDRDLDPEAAWYWYVDRYSVVSFEVRPEVRRGDPLPMILTCYNPKVHRDDNDLRVAGECAVVEIDGRRIFDGPAMFGECSEAGDWTGAIEADRLMELEPGPHHIRMVMPMWQVCSYSDGLEGPLWVPLADLEMEADFQMLPADQPTIYAVHDPKLFPSIRRGIEIKRSTFNEVEVSFDRLRCDVAFKATIRATKGTQMIRQIACAKGRVQHHMLTGFNTLMVADDNEQDEEPDPIEVVLTADPEAAVRSVNVTGYLDGEFVMKRVYVNDR